MMHGTTMKDVGEDDGVDLYVPFKQDGTFNPFRPKPPEELPETFKSERSFAKHTVAAPQRIRRLVSIAKGRELLRQRQSVEVGQPLLHGKKGEDGNMIAGGLDGVKTDVDTEAEDSEVSVAEHCDDGRPTVFDFSSKKKEEQDGCGHLFISSTGPLRSADEPPDFLQLPEPIKQRTAGAARVAAAARAWAAASITTPAPAPGAFSGPWQQAGAAAGQPNQDVMLPPTARGMPPPGNAAAAIAAELQRQNNLGNQQNDALGGPAANHQSLQAYQMQPGNQQPIAESREVVAGPAVLALRRMRNRMSALAEGRMPWNFSRPSAQSQQAQSSQQAQQPVQQAQPVQQMQLADQRQGQPHMQQLPLQPQPPQQPHNGPRRPLLPNLGVRSNAAASSSAVPASGPASAGAASSPGSAAADSFGGAIPAPSAGSGAASFSGPAAAASSGDGPAAAAGCAAASDEPQMQSIVPEPPGQPKPPSSSGGRFWKRPWPRLGWGGSSSSSSGAASSSSPPAGSSAAASSSQGASSSRQPHGEAG
eukprot:TRINITY_DN6119_c2_g1_i1.p1 TRINITY_DN6119_c2_g1~~TRINITY_DN6119_c2_g1_i1.p1  ORF type:complete len:533 (-),score=137.19 TRINITY_DN6119_c2_g1_i1:193-1791(-)